MKENQDIYLFAFFLIVGMEISAHACQSWKYISVKYISVYFYGKINLSVLYLSKKNQKQ